MQNRSTIFLIKIVGLLMISLSVISCSNESANNKQTIAKRADKGASQKLTNSEANDTLNTATSKFKITENVTDYCYLFGIGADFNAFKNLSRTQAFNQKTYMLGTLNYEKGFLRFHTCNTPLDWDGDAKTEWDYNITYWNIESEKRFIALTTTQVTWVSSETESVTFYIQDRHGINEFTWDNFSWNLGDFIGQEYKALFDDSMWAQPPVVIELPEEGKEIQVELAFHEYMDNVKAYNVYDSLQLFKIESTLKFNPLNDFLD